MSRVSIRELAEACGVSISTVSKALRHTGRISEATVRLVEEKAAALGYTASGAARALASGNRRIGVLLPLASPYLAEYREGIARAAALLSAYGILAEEVTPAEAAACDALLSHPLYAPRLALPEGFPLAVFGGRAPTLHPLFEALPEYRVGGRIAAQFLAFSTGGGQTAAFAMRRGAYSEEEALRGFREISAKLGVPPCEVLECGDSARTAASEIRHFLAANPRLRGVFVTAPLVGTVAPLLAEAKKKIYLLGADFTAAAKDALRAGSATALLYPAPVRQVEAALLSLARFLVAGGATPPISVRMELVLKSNLDSYR